MLLSLQLLAVTLLELKPLLPQMLDAVVALDQISFGGLWTRSGYQRELDSPNSDLLGLFIPLPDRLLAIGCLWAILEEAHITILAVHPDYQRQGLGQAMLIALLMAAQQRALERATLEVRASNQSALSLYQKFGFELAGRRRLYYQDTGEDALILWRSGLQHPKFSQDLVHLQHHVCAHLRTAGWEVSKLFS